MYYSLVGCLALLTLLITNHDILRKVSRYSDTTVGRVYRRFLIAVALYYVTDMLWGILEAISSAPLLFIDTEVYFVAMALGILFWTQYVDEYLEEENDVFRKFLHYGGWAFFIAMVVMIALNLFVPVMFWVDGECVYHALPARHVLLCVQIFILLLTVLHALGTARHSDGKGKGRYRTVALSASIMGAFICLQLFAPYLPLYAIGYMLSCEVMRTFVIESEREEYRVELESSLEREKRQREKLDEAWQLAYTDALTGAGSKLAYIEKQDELDNDIVDGKIDGLALVVCDMNDLKGLNDTLGHDAGDAAIVEAYRLAKDRFPHSPVFRIGGDEFVIVLEGEDYANREPLMEALDSEMEERAASGQPALACGMAEFPADAGKGYRELFALADQRMYERKKALKGSSPRQSATGL